MEHLSFSPWTLVVAHCSQKRSLRRRKSRGSSRILKLLEPSTTRTSNHRRGGLGRRHGPGGRRRGRSHRCAGPARTRHAPQTRLAHGQGAGRVHELTLLRGVTAGDRPHEELAPAYTANVMVHPSFAHTHNALIGNQLWRLQSGQIHHVRRSCSPPPQRCGDHNGRAWVVHVERSGGRNAGP